VAGKPFRVGINDVGEWRLTEEDGLDGEPNGG